MAMGDPSPRFHSKLRLLPVDVLITVVSSPNTSGLDVVKAATGGMSSMTTVVLALSLLTLLLAVTVAV